MASLCLLLKNVYFIKLHYTVPLCFPEPGFPFALSFASFIKQSKDQNNNINENISNIFIEISPVLCIYMTVNNNVFGVETSKVLLLCHNLQCKFKSFSDELKMRVHGASLVAQWLRICLPMQGTWVRALVWEDPTCRGATGPMSHNY